MISMLYQVLEYQLDIFRDIETATIPIIWENLLSFIQKCCWIIPLILQDLAKEN